MERVDSESEEWITGDDADDFDVDVEEEDADGVVSVT